MASVNKVILEQLYVTERKSVPDVAKAIGLSYSTTRAAILASGITLRSRAEGVRAASNKLGHHLRGKSRTFTAEWKDNISAAKLAAAELTAKGISEKANGYTQITRGENKGRGLHVVLVEQSIGRRLNPDEVVHHIDGNPRNNDISNLQLMTRSNHTRLHRLEQSKGANHGKR